ncbi:MAG: archease, partial [Gemmatimonadota bacterium]
MSEGTEIPVPGVSSLEHTADVAIEVEAPDAPELFRRSALAMVYLLLERVPDDGTESRRVKVSSPDVPGLLREWLRELLYWHETEGFALASCRFERLEVPRDPGSEGAESDEAASPRRPSE